MKTKKKFRTLLTTKSFYLWCRGLTVNMRGSGNILMMFDTTKMEITISQNGIVKWIARMSGFHAIFLQTEI